MIRRKDVSGIEVEVGRHIENSIFRHAIKISGRFSQGSSTPPSGKKSADGLICIVRTGIIVQKEEMSRPSGRRYVAIFLGVSKTKKDGSFVGE